MRKQALLVGSLLLLVGCNATSNTAGSTEGGMHPGFGGASGISGYGTPGTGGSKAYIHADTSSSAKDDSARYRTGLRTSNNSFYN